MVSLAAISALTVTALITSFAFPVHAQNADRLSPAQKRELENQREAVKLSEKTTQPLEAVNPLKAQYLVFEVPGLPLYGSDYHAWYVLRGPLLWTPTGSVDLSKINWPKWDFAQVPPAITYTGGNETEAVVLDERGELIERVSLKKAWSPGLYKPPPGKTPHALRIEVADRPERFRMISKTYPWPKVKEFFKCEIEVVTADFEQGQFDSKTDVVFGRDSDDQSKKNPPLEQHPKVKLCMESLQGVAKNPEMGKQWYVSIAWPKPQTRRSQIYISDMEREFKRGLSKNKNVLITHRGEGRFFTASAGLTQVEQIQKIAIDTASLPTAEWHGSTPTNAEAVKTIAEHDTADGGKLIINAFSSDSIVKRSIDSPAEFNPPINVQFVRATKPQTESLKEQTPPVRQTEFREERTGLSGFLRPWLISASGNYHQLKSGRGEDVASFNGPGFEIAWRSPYRGIEPFFTMDSGLVHYDTTLALQETHFGARWRWKPRFSPSLGFFSYALRGRNPGSTRLGSINGFSGGGHTTVRIEDYIIRGSAHVILTTPFSWDTYAEVAKIIDKGASDRGLYFGVFMGYTVYRSELLNPIRQLETFSENRFKFGVTLGIAGPDYLE